jgi:hypothetical protein
MDPTLKSGMQSTTIKKIKVINAASQFGMCLFASQEKMGKRTIEKEAPRTRTVQNGRKMKNAKTRVIIKSPKKKYFSIVFGCI